MADRGAEFGCEACNSPSVVLPAALHDDALVLCGACRSVIGSWGAFKQQALRAIPPGSRKEPLCQRVFRFEADPVEAA